MGSNSYRRLSLLGFSHPVVEPPFQVHEKTALFRGRDYEAGQTVALIHVLCNERTSFNICFVLRVQ